MKVILITGNTGFIGKNIMKSNLINQNNIICINRGKTYKKKFFNINIKDYKKIQNFNIDLLIHLASADPENCPAKLILKKNKKIDNILLFLNKTNNIKKVFFTSSNSVFQENNEKRIIYKTVPKPKNFYGRSKLITEKIIMKNFKSFVILRLPSIIGHNLKKGLIYRFLQKINKNKEIKIFNKDKKFNNIFDVKDLTKIINKFANTKQNYKAIINLCSINSLSIFELVKLLCKIKNKKINIKDCGLSKNYKFFVWKKSQLLKNIKFKTIKEILKSNI
jgi:nucleoside-diphosphate-sugar epimerase